MERGGNKAKAEETQINAQSKVDGGEPSDPEIERTRRELKNLKNVLSKGEKDNTALGGESASEFFEKLRREGKA